MDNTDILVHRLAKLPVANISDAMERLNVCDSGIRTTWPGAVLVGRARTVLTRSGDNLWVHHAVAAIQPGEVLAVAGGGDVSRALVGELVAGRAKARGCAGIVIDGAVRDVPAFQRLDIPVFARAVTPAGPYKFGPGYLDRPIAVGGVVVAPGDYLVGDADGVAVVAADQAAEVAAAAERQSAKEELERTRIAQSLAEPN
ncbi:methyltransferase [Saccharopolyspora sp. K220]|uniref:RraA family protein n=1 Tax=Saccharopolyspora soli TaxID=2926618 RepID=UPI001F59A481|nr:methyltransferase [Saccharopolyspora soli]MCI2421742.1 methyltransferase [Saccharopolyspora soli]